MMELNHTVAMMESTDYQERFKAEYYQLKIRAAKLEAILEKYKAGTLTFIPSCCYELLFEQLVYMRNYLRVLEERASIEAIELQGEEE